MSLEGNIINFSTVAGNPTASLSIDDTGNLNMNPATSAAVLLNNLSLSGTSSSDPTATITADASGDILLTPASGGVCNIGGVEIFTDSSGSQYIQSNGFSNLSIGNGEENAISITSTNYVNINSLQVNYNNGTTISTTSASDLSIGGSSISNTTCADIGICATNAIGLNYLSVKNASSSPTITATDSMTLTASDGTINFSPSAGYLRMSNTPYFTSVGSSVQSFTLPCGGVFLMTMVANATSGDQASVPSLSDLWYVFSTGSSNVISPYSSSNEPVSGYYVGVNANGVIGVQSFTSSNTISVAVYESDAYFYNFYLTMIS